MGKRFFITVFFVVTNLLVLTAQQVRVTADTDTIATDTANIHSPKKASIYSAVLPGLGQIYNKKYWKLPIVYGAVGACVYSIISNQKKYKDYRFAYFYNVDNDQSTTNSQFPDLTNAQLIALRDQHRTLMEYSYIGLGFVYLLQIADAAVDAHFFYFDVSEDLTINASPTVIYSQNSAVPAIGLNLKF